jgi:GAF domain-containing protein
MKQTLTGNSDSDAVFLKEEGRLQAMQRYLIFNLDRQKELDEIVKLASMICQTPIALLTLMDKDIQWIKAKVGADIDRMPRETSFCTHAIEMQEMMIVPDAVLDLRFSEAPVVVNDPHIRFYAGANLTSYDGFNVGTLCVYDLEPKTLTVAQQEALAALANQVSHIMELDRALKLLKEQNSALTEIARIQSHEIRLPVSSIMGVMQLIKDADYHPEAEHLQLLEQSVNQLDEKIRLIVKATK